MLADLNPGCSHQEINELEDSLNCQLPEDFKTFYQRHNGQKGNSTGLFFGLPFLSIVNLFEEWSAWRELADDDFAMDITGESYPNGAIKTIYINLKWIPIANDGSGNHIGIDLDPDDAGLVGQVINFGRDENNKFVLAPSLADFIAWMLAQYQAGNYQSNKRSLNIKQPAFDHFLDAVPLLFGRS
ncbi:SMI1/KNR4 family protein [Calothrix sp. NIES-2098]|uniref:SMI1/KNR4 family protein n=1 Tax=Calothrix sp. NIES-2098 TaxID=1954171 RepID=UPI000B610F74|nr:protein involved in beta-1 3-glucan synthesis-like protein [Calothrix sp. NIES-2098]